MEFTIGQIAELINGTVIGDSAATINNVGKIEDAGPGCISFFSNPKYEQYVYSTNATAVIVRSDFKPKQEPKASLIKVEDPYSSFTVLLEQYQRLRLMQKKGIESPSHIGSGVTKGEGFYLGAFSYVGDNVSIGENVKIFPQCHIGDGVTIGDNVVLHPGVKIYADCVLGSYVNLHSGVVIGSDGFGFAPQPDGSYKTIPQVGIVKIGNHVDIGANTVIDRATMGTTLIGDGVKLDNLVQIAHNVEVGNHTVIASQTGIAGSTKVGKYSVLGGQVGLGGHITLADKTSIGAQTGIGYSVTKEGTAIMGSPGVPIKNFFRSHAVLKTLPDMARRLRELEQKVIDLPSAKKS